MSEQIEERVRDAYDGLTPSPESERDLLDDVARTAQVGPARRRWEVLVAAAAAIVAAVLLLLPADPGPEREPVAPAAPGTSAMERPLVASAVTEDGEFRLDLEVIEVRPPAPGSVENPTVTLQGRVVIDDPHTVLGPRLSVPRLALPGGLDRTPESPWTQVLHARFGSFSINYLDLGPEPARIADLVIEATILRLRDADHRFEGIGPGERVERMVPPYALGFWAEPTIFHLTSVMTDESIRAAKADLKDAWPGNQAVASSARVVDADGKVLECHGGSGSGGNATAMYSPGWSGDPIAYPVTVTVPDPTPVERIPAVFRFRDLELPAVRDRYVSDSPWGPTVAGLTMRADVPTRVEQGERIAATIEIVRRKGEALPEGVTRLETRSVETLTVLRLVPEGGGEEIVLRPEDQTLGMPDPPEPGDREPNLDRDLAIRVVFPLAPRHEQLPPGKYECVTELSVPDPGDARLWRGTLRSGRFPLEVVAEPARTRKLRLPTRLTLAKGLRVTFRPEDTEPVTVPRRNGYYLGTTWSVDGADGRGVMRSGVPAPGDPNPLINLPRDHEGPFVTMVTMVVFHAFDPPGHHWSPRGGHEVLWSRTFEVSFTAEEIEAMR